MIFDFFVEELFFFFQDAENHKYKNESLLQEIDGLKMQITHMENDKGFFIDQIEELKRNLRQKSEEIDHFEQKKLSEITRIRFEIESEQSQKLVDLPIKISLLIEFLCIIGNFDKRNNNEIAFRTRKS